ncbi:MAG: EamA family transporter [Oscillospiraceae bacterium]|nr:EamA family transporter [Oscillospiraceae bacterium]
MWLILAFLSAGFAAMSTVLAKLGEKDIDSTFATFLRTGVVLIFSWAIVLATGKIGQIGQISFSAWLFLVLSGLATGGSWLCYFRALQLGNAGSVAAVDKTSTVLTVILAFIIFDEKVTPVRIVAIVLMLAGALLVAYDGSKSKAADKPHKRQWLLYAVLSAVFAASTSVLAKLGIRDIDSNLATAIRTVVVLLMSGIMIPIKSRGKTMVVPKGRQALLLVLSGVATGGSWLCYFNALQTGQASVVVPVDKLSIVLIAVFSRLFLKEKLSAYSVTGLSAVTVGTLLMLL